MRGCHGHDHTASNEEMWNREGLPEVVVPSYTPPKPCPMAEAAVEEQGVGE